MRRILSSFALAGAVLVAAAPRARADAHTVIDNDKHTTIACKKGDTAEITGNNNTITLTGECASVSVSGNSNTVKIDTAGAINATGNHNAITWKRGAGGKDPAVSDVGNGNKVAKTK